ncbi:hypothetical protein [Flavobacterium silvaticum]|uniref:Uncharacterized protein n=1 Tax=Flavobacterium silvaticum TaxID=1852020 RepID=A0A972FRL8_9FLAO|nr:hypothetical protein [Flavobacterium silvaticum]NMH26722.1 hypothetical protein [Flavobacterium silvaticum]
MDKLNSISLVIMGIGFLLLAKFMSGLLLQALAVSISIGFSVVAIVRSFREKKEKNL